MCQNAELSLLIKILLQTCTLYIYERESVVTEIKLNFEKRDSLVKSFILIFNTQTQNIIETSFQVVSEIYAFIQRVNCVNLEA